MPELPEIGALVDHLRRPAVGTTIGRVDVAALSVLKTFDSPINALHGQTVTGAGRWGKYLGVQAGPLWLIAHLSRAGWLRWSDKLAAAPLPPGKGPIALRVHLGTPGWHPASISPKPGPRSAWQSGWSRIRGRCPASPRSDRMRSNSGPRSWPASWAPTPAGSRRS
ncbi:hypothetical protein OSJ04_23645 [Mycobacterium ulcerans]